MFDDTPDFNSPTSTPAAVPNNPSAVPNTPSPVPTASPVPTDSGSMPGAMSGPAPTQPTPTAAQPSVPPAVLQAQHESMLGKAVRAIMGTPVEYQVGPDGKTVAVPVKEKPGDLFRHILGGVLLGGAVGARERTPAAAAGAGAQAVRNVIQTQDRENYERAQQDFKNAQTVDQQNDRKMLLKAQMAQLNAATLRETLLYNKESYDFHQKMAQDGKGLLAAYDKAGIQPRYRDVPAEQLDSIFNKDQDAIAYHWEPTGTKVVLGKDGTPTYQLTWSAVDPHDKIPVTQDFVKQFKDAEADKYQPGVVEILQGMADKGAKWTPQEYGVMVDTLKNARADKYAQQHQDATLQELQARARKDNAEAVKAVNENRAARAGLTKQKALDAALDGLNKVGGDMTKLSPKDRLLISESARGMVSNLNNAIRQALASNDQETAKDLMGQVEAWSHLATSSIQGMTPPATSGKQVNPRVKNLIDVMKQDEEIDPKSSKAYDYINGSNLSPDEKLDALKVSGALVPWSAVVSGARAGGVSRAQYVQFLKSKNIHVENPPETLKQMDRSMTPEQQEQQTQINAMPF